MFPSLFGRRGGERKSKPAPRRSSFRPGVEGLEDRRLLATTKLINGTLFITGSDAADAISVSRKSNWGDYVVVDDGSPWYSWSTPHEYRAAEVVRIDIDARGGDDLVQINDSINVDRKSTRLNSSHIQKSRMPSSA